MAHSVFPEKYRVLIRYLIILCDRPNTITLLGFSAIISSYFMTWYFVGEDGVLPGFVFVLNAFFVFFYQTMDALDGKQARRTGMASPLGELFDHGCDAVTTVVCFFFFWIYICSFWRLRIIVFFGLNMVGFFI